MTAHYQLGMLLRFSGDATVVFGMLDELERASRPIMEAARETLAADKGADALELLR